MTVRIPEHVTYCYTCERQNVGVVKDVNAQRERWRMARHRTVYGDKSSVICVGSRVEVPNALVFLNEEWLHRHGVDADA